MEGSLARHQRWHDICILVNLFRAKNVLAFGSFGLYRAVVFFTHDYDVKSVICFIFTSLLIDVLLTFRTNKWVFLCSAATTLQSWHHLFPLSGVSNH